MLDCNAWADIFVPLQNKRVGYSESIGNVGDKLIQMGMYKCLAYYNIEIVQDNFDFILTSGGGNFGNLYPDEREHRETALKTGCPVIVLPQTAFDDYEYHYLYYKVYFRERESFKNYRKPLFAPDLSLCLTYEPKAAEFGRGIFLRNERERRLDFQHPENLGDPILLVEKPTDYLELAAKYESIITNRLHLAISGLICGRDVTLLPNSYFKNKAVYEASLRELGCKWQDDLSFLQ